MWARGARLAGCWIAWCACAARADVPAPPPTTTSASVTVAERAAATTASPPPATRPANFPTTRPATRPASIFTEESAPLPTEPGDHKLRFHTQVGKKRVDMAVLLHLPPGYRPRDAAQPAPPAPMILFMHGGGECGSDCAALYTNGPMTMLRKTDRDARFAASFPFVLLAPQCPPRGQRWDQESMVQAVLKLIDDFIPRANVDPDRVYLTGLSMGGVGSWRVAYAAPQRFAAVAPMSAVSYKPNLTAAKLWHTAIWSVVGADDSEWFLGGTRQMNNALSDSPAEVRFTYLVGNGHDAWWPTYASPQFYEWLLGQRRGVNGTATPPSFAATTQATTQPSPPLASAPLPSTQPVATTRPSSPLPNQPGHYRLAFDVSVGPQPYQLDYLLYLPRDYRPSGPAHPAMLFLHEERSIGPDWAGLCPHGPDLELERPGANLGDSFPFVVISPRLPIKCDWNTPGMNEALLALLDHVQNGLNLDRARISISGINGGAAEATTLAAAAPDRFAAVAPVMSEGPLKVAGEQLKPLALVAIWAQVRASQAASLESLKSTDARSELPRRLETMANATSVALPVDTSIYANRDFLNWLAQQRKTAVPARSASTDGSLRF
jgi:predicted peptidase